MNDDEFDMCNLMNCLFVAPPLIGRRCRCLNMHFLQYSGLKQKTKTKRNRKVLMTINNSLKNKETHHSHFVRYWKVFIFVVSLNCDSVDLLLLVFRVFVLCSRFLWVLSLLFLKFFFRVLLFGTKLNICKIHAQDTMDLHWRLNYSSLNKFAWIVWNATLCCLEF